MAINAAADNRYRPNKSERNFVLMDNLCSLEKRKKNGKQNQMRSPSAERHASIQVTSSGATAQPTVITITCASRKFHLDFARRLPLRLDYVIRMMQIEWKFFFSKDLDQHFLFRLKYLHSFTFQLVRTLHT